MMQHSWLVLATAAVVPGVAAVPAPTQISLQDDPELLDDYVQTRLERVLDRAHEAVSLLAGQACWPGRGRSAYQSLRQEYDRVAEQARALLGHYPRTAILMVDCPHRHPEVVPELEARAQRNLRLARRMIRRGETD